MKGDQTGKKACMPLAPVFGIIGLVFFQSCMGVQPAANNSDELKQAGVSNKQFMELRERLYERRLDDPRSWHEFRKNFNLDAGGNPIKKRSMEQIRQHRDAKQEEVRK